MNRTTELNPTQLNAMPPDPQVHPYAVRCARQVQHLMRDQRSINALDVAEKYDRGEASFDELSKAQSAAWAAANELSKARWSMPVWDTAREVAMVEADAAWVAAIALDAVVKAGEASRDIAVIAERIKRSSNESRRD